MAIWKGISPLFRPDGRIMLGDEFTPTEAERQAFSDLIEEADVHAQLGMPVEQPNPEPE